MTNAEGASTISTEEIRLTGLEPLMMYRCVKSITRSDYEDSLFYPRVDAGDILLVNNHYNKSRYLQVVLLKGGRFLNLRGVSIQTVMDDRLTGRFISLDPEEYDSYIGEIKKCGLGNLFLNGCSGIVSNSGADPELFVLDKKGQVIPAWEFLPKKPKDTLDVAYADGFACEFAPSHGGCHGRLTDRFRTLITEISTAARRKYPNSKLSWNPVVQVSQEMLDKATDNQVALGCDPSFNAYTGDEALGLQGIDPRRLLLRVAGCHVHFSGRTMDIDIKQFSDKAIKAIIRAMDAVAGVMSVSLLRGMEDPIRRVYYGRAGEYRRPPHGVEWRVLSSAVLASPVLMNLMFDSARASTQLGLQNGRLLDTILSGYSPERIQAIINETDPREALKFIQENKSFYESFLGTIYSPGVTTKLAQDLIYSGAINCLDTSNMEENWRINIMETEKYLPMSVYAASLTKDFRLKG